MDFGLCEKVASFIMRPPRSSYCVEDLGHKKFQYLEKFYERVDFQVQNSQGLKLVCSYFKEIYTKKPKQTIVFLHANSSSRLAVKNYLEQCLPEFNVVCFDSSGSGMSEGKYVTLGYNEKQDLLAVVRTIKKRFGQQKVILWGRSMGAVTALLYAAKFPDYIKAVVSDNAFCDLERVCKQLKDSYFPLIPDFLVSGLLDSVQEEIDLKINQPERMDFKLKKLIPKEVVGSIKSPIFFIYSKDDKMVNNQHTKQLYDLTNSHKQIIGVKGDHNTSREQSTKKMVIQFLLRVSIIQKGKQSLHSTKTTYISDKRLNANETVKNETVFESPLDKKLCSNIHSNRGRSQTKRKLSITQSRSSIRNSRSNIFESHISFENQQESTADLKNQDFFLADSTIGTRKKPRKKIFTRPTFSILK